MILFDLKCGEGHVFEAWFRNSGAYEAQAAANEIACPICGDTRIAKAPMAPRIGKSRQEVEKTETATLRRAEVMRELVELRRKVEEKCDYVGDRFAEEARRIHYGEIEKRDIYGEATETETTELRKRASWSSGFPGFQRLIPESLYMPQSGPASRSRLRALAAA